MTTDHPDTAPDETPDSRGRRPGPRLPVLLDPVLPARASETVAIGHAHDVVTVERSLGFHFEPSVNAWLATHPTLASLASMQYAATFLLFTGLALLALWIKIAPVLRAGALDARHHDGWCVVTYWTVPHSAPPRLRPRPRHHRRRRTAHLRLFPAVWNPRQPLRSHALPCIRDGRCGSPSCSERTSGAHGGRVSH